MIKFNLFKGSISVNASSYDDNGFVLFDNISDQTIADLLNHVAMTGGVPAIKYDGKKYIAIPRDVEFALTGLHLKFKVTGKFNKLTNPPIDRDKLY